MGLTDTPPGRAVHAGDAARRRGVAFPLYWRTSGLPLASIDPHAFPPQATHPFAPWKTTDRPAGITCDAGRSRGCENAAIELVDCVTGWEFLDLESSEKLFEYLRRTA